MCLFEHIEIDTILIFYSGSGFGGRHFYFDQKLRPHQLGNNQQHRCRPQFAEEVRAHFHVGRDVFGTTFGRLAIRSSYRSPEVNAYGCLHRLSCASNERNLARHTWDKRNA